MRSLKAVVVAVVAAAVTTVTGPVTPAAADWPYTPFCYDDHGKVACRRVPVLKLDCPPYCYVVIDWRHWWPDPVDWQRFVGERITTGMFDLGEAAEATKPDERARLRAEALDAFQAVTDTVKDGKLVAAQVGQVDPDSGVFKPEPIPYLQAAGDDIADGIGYLQLDRVSPGKYLELAVAQFDEAYLEFSELTVVAG